MFCKLLPVNSNISWQLRVCCVGNYSSGRKIVKRKPVAQWFFFIKSRRKKPSVSLCSATVNIVKSLLQERNSIFNSKRNWRKIVLKNTGKCRIIKYCLAVYLGKRVHENPTKNTHTVTEARSNFNLLNPSLFLSLLFL